MKRPDDYKARAAHLADLSDEQLHARFWELAKTLTDPLLRMGWEYTTPSIERSVLLRMGFSSLEAKALEKDLLTRILRIEEWVERIRERAPDIKEDRFTQVRERLSELLDRHGQELDENRFIQEIALMADKLDVSEELTRLAVHLDRLRDLLSAGKDAGRKLDFTMQECFREITTCGNKIQDVQVSRLVVDVKNELEKCREQVQNVE